MFFYFIIYGFLWNISVLADSESRDSSKWSDSAITRLSEKLRLLEYALSAATEKIETQEGLIQKLLDEQQSCSDSEDAAESILVNLIQEQVFAGEDLTESVPEDSSEDLEELEDPVSAVIGKWQEETGEESGEESEVELWIYDLSRGFAKLVSEQFLGFKVEAIYHTSAVLFDREYYFAAGKGDDSSGIKIIVPGTTKLGKPIRKLPMGSTRISKAEFENFIQELGKSKYTSRTYSLLEHNCNHFTEDVMQKIVQKSIPQEIRDLPEKVLKTPFGKMINKKLKALGNVH